MFPLNSDDVKGVEDIWGDDLLFLAGKSPHISNPHIRATLMTTHVTILQSYRDVTLTGDVMYINGIRFINTISCQIKFMTS